MGLNPGSTFSLISSIPALWERHQQQAYWLNVAEVGIFADAAGIGVDGRVQDVDDGAPANNWGRLAGVYGDTQGMKNKANR